MSIFKRKKWIAFWESESTFDPIGGDGKYVLQYLEGNSVTIRGIFKNDNQDAPIELEDLIEKFPQLKKLIHQHSLDF